MKAEFASKKCRRGTNPACCVPRQGRDPQTSGLPPRPNATDAAIRFPDDRPSQYFYWDDLPARRLRPETLDRETALEKAKAAATAAQRLADARSREG
jgi:hypothetical protein